MDEKRKEQMRGALRVRIAIVVCGVGGVLAAWGSLLWLALWKAAPPLLVDCAALAAVASTVSCALAWKNLLQPLRLLRRGIRAWKTRPSGKLRESLLSLPAPLDEVAAAYCEQMEQTEREAAGLRERVQRETGEEVRRQTALDICESVLPQGLRQYPSREYFEIAGEVRQGRGVTCAFYDYFYIDPGLLCLIIGQMEGESVPDAVHMAVAQTAIQNRLRMGQSLAETLSEVNAQLYDFGTRKVLQALAAALDTFSGRMTYVNAGGSVPLMMRSGERCVWLDTPTMAPLGQFERVRYRAMEVQLRKGDRILWFTRGLEERTGADGTLFRDQGLRAAWNQIAGNQDAENRRMGEGADLPGMLAHLAREADAYSQGGESPGYAVMALEYRKGDRELTHCRVPARAESLQRVQEFMKNRFRESGLRRKYAARVTVLGEELFSLCCRGAKPDSFLNFECGVAQDRQSVTLRVGGAFQGVNPLEAGAEDRLTENAAAFITGHAEYTSFQPGKEEDVVTLVSFQEDQSGQSGNAAAAGAVKRFTKPNRSQAVSPPGPGAAGRPLAEGPGTAERRFGTAESDAAEPGNRREARTKTYTEDPEHPLKVAKQREGDRLTIALAGRVDSSTVPDLEAYLRTEADSVTELVFDLRYLVSITSAGLRVLLSMQKKMNQRGTMTVRNVSEDIMDEFEMTGFVDILTIET